MVWGGETRGRGAWEGEDHGWGATRVKVGEKVHQRLQGVHPEYSERQDPVVEAPDPRLCVVHLRVKNVLFPPGFSKVAMSTVKDFDE